jgi:myo-inositol-1(or 4)-monophosphatase
VLEKEGECKMSEMPAMLRLRGPDRSPKPSRDDQSIDGADLLPQWAVSLGKACPWPAKDEVLAYPNELTAQEALGLLVPAMREAGEIGLKFGREGVKSFVKLDTSPVTEADLAIDLHLAQRLRRASSAIGWLSEEAADTVDRLSRRQVWIVDPIDGTRGFMSGNGEWVISAALVDNGRPIAGALLRPTTGDLYEATIGGGATLNGRRLVATDGTLEATRTAAGPKLYVDELKRVAPDLERWPSLSSLALRLALVAEGQIDAAFAKDAAHDWDIAAAELIVREAGGNVTWLDGKAIVYNRPDPVHPPLVAAGQARQRDLAALLRESVSVHH